MLLLRLFWPLCMPPRSARVRASASAAVMLRRTRSHLHAEEAASDDDASMGRREEVESSSDELSSGEEGNVDSSSVSSASEASGDTGVDEGAEAGLGVAALRQPRAPKVLITDLHRLKPRRMCKHGCGALGWREEGKLCCKGGTHILVPVYNPPIDPEYGPFSSYRT